MNLVADSGPSVDRLNGVYEQFIAKVNAQGRDLGWSTQALVWKGPSGFREHDGRLVVSWMSQGALDANKDLVEAAWADVGGGEVEHEISVSRPFGMDGALVRTW